MFLIMTSLQEDERCIKLHFRAETPFQEAEQHVEQSVRSVTLNQENLLGNNKNMCTDAEIMH